MSQDDFIRRYFQDWRVLRSGNRAERLAVRDAEDQPTDEQIEMLHTLTEPERAWPVILALIEAAPNEEALAFVAAGPLEDLIQSHGNDFADRIIERARRDPRFRSALRDVWAGSTSRSRSAVASSSYCGRLRRL
jgi:hypothetical protein